MIQKRPRQTYRRRYARGTNKAFVARIARNVMRREEETKCFTQTVVAANTSVTNTWVFNSAIAGLVTGAGNTNRVGSKVTLVALEFFIMLAPATANVPDNGSACRLVIYHNKAAGYAVPSAAEVWDNNQIVTGRNVSFVHKYSILEDITHQMVLTARDNTGKYASGPQLTKCLRVTPRTAVEFGGNVGSISDLFAHDFGVGFVSDDVNCCTLNVITKVWFKDA